MHGKKTILFAMATFLFSSGCAQEALTIAEVRLALDEVSQSSQALTTASSTIEICTNFTIGEAVQAAAEELRNFIESQLPCAEITLDGAKLSVVYGALAGNCTYHDQTYSGSHVIEIVSAAAGDLLVHHEWDELSNGKLTVSGTADVTWSAAGGSRNVVHELDWTRLADGKQVTGSGDRTQTTLPAGILEGISIDGARAWTADTGDWYLDISGVEVRWVDPVPQAGVYELSTPFEGKTARMTFARVDEDTIAVTVTTGGVGFRFDVTKSGDISG